jgi:hypothetical protein
LPIEKNRFLTQFEVIPSRIKLSVAYLPFNSAHAPSAKDKTRLAVLCARSSSFTLVPVTSHLLLLHKIYY